MILMTDNPFEPYGGMGVFVKNLCKCLHKYVDFHIVGNDLYVDDSPYFKYYPYKMEYDFFELNDRDNFSVSKFTSNYNILSLLEELPKCDIVNCLDLSTFIAGKIISNKHGSKLVNSIHLSYSEMVKGYDLNSIEKILVDMEFHAMLNADLNIFVSDYYKSQFNVPNSISIPNGVLHPDNRIKMEIPSIGRKYKLLYIGRYAYQKNVQSIIRADIPSDIELYFAGNATAGDINIYNEMLDYCNKNEHAHYLGYIQDSEKSYLYNAVDAVIFPSLHEPFGLVGLEAMAHSKILLSSGIHGMETYCKPGTYINCGVTPQSITNALYDFINRTDLEKIKINGYLISTEHSMVSCSLKYLLNFIKLVKP